MFMSVLMNITPVIYFHIFICNNYESCKMTIGKFLFQACDNIEYLNIGRLTFKFFQNAANLQGKQTYTW
jgi:hypothetical protein